MNKNIAGIIIIACLSILIIISLSGITGFVIFSETSIKNYTSIFLFFAILIASFYIIKKNKKV